MTLTPHPLTNFQIQEYYQNEARFNGVFSRDNLHNSIKDGTYAINLDQYSDIRTHWLALHVKNKIVTYSDSIGIEIFQKNIYRIQAYDSIMCGYFCIGFINLMFNGNSLPDYASLFSPNDLKKKQKR